jgi:hypothetical protein
MRRSEFMALMESIAVFVVVTLAAANIAAATKRAEAPVKNTIQCSAFKKMLDGTWYVEGPTTFRIGTFKKTTFTQQSIDCLRIDVNQSVIEFFASRAQTSRIFSTARCSKAAFQ